ncbi:hypothetical protein ACR9GP_21435 [Enterobacter ludwigii]
MLTMNGVDAWQHGATPGEDVVLEGWLCHYPIANFRLSRDAIWFIVQVIRIH